MAKLSVFSGTKTSDSESHADSGGHSMAVTESANGLLSEERFRQMLARERKRSERSRKHLLLMLIDAKDVTSRKVDPLLKQIADVLCSTIRETDLAGWFETHTAVGVIFTEFGDSDVAAAAKIIESKVMSELQKAFKATQLSKCQISFYTFPDGPEGNLAFAQLSR